MDINIWKEDVIIHIDYSQKPAFTYNGFIRKTGELYSSGIGEHGYSFCRLQRCAGDYIQPGTVDMKELWLTWIQISDQ
jgi:hypothetical protein